MKLPTSHRTTSGFSFLEALTTLAILGIMAALVVSAFSNANTDAARIMARQQQAAIQAAVNAWVNSDGNRSDVINATAGTGKLRTIAEIQTDYNNHTGSLARLTLVSPYMDPTTATYLIGGSSSSKILSDSLSTAKQYITLPDWTSGSYPQVTLNSN